MIGKHLLSSADLERDDIETILDHRGLDARRATPRGQEAAHPARAHRHQPLLRGLHPHSQLVRDRRQVDVGRHHQHLGKGSSTSKGESLRDTVKTIAAMSVDALVIRHNASGACHQVSQWVDASVINAGDGTHEHPTQALLDAYTLRHRLGDLTGRHVVIVGDLAHSRVFRSNVITLATLGARVTVVAPPTLMPSGIGAWSARDGFATSWDLDEILYAASTHRPDAVMMLRVQKERMSGGFFPTERGSTPLAMGSPPSAWSDCMPPTPRPRSCTRAR
jgi:aspartate carbamoyltransferase catalytic subunit